MLLAFIILTLFPIASSGQVSIPPDREGLLRGDGMGLALPAEMTGFPGPKHVVELKDQLTLSKDQLKKAETLPNLVKVSASAKGEQIVEAEEELNKLFESGSVSEQVLRT